MRKPLFDRAAETAEKVPLGQVSLVEAILAASMPPFGFDFATSMSQPKHPPCMRKE
ncbi:MAG: hypothetical protein J6A16_08080 [Oscillospiraceae bacterium]|nr:hypothetical protein [Oscillospiraceae bacterium]